MSAQRNNANFGEFLDAEEDLGWYQDHITDAALAQIPGFGATGPRRPGVPTGGAGR